MNKLPKARTSDVVVQEFGDEILIYDLKTHRIYSLNETSSFVWQSCNGTKSVDEIVNQINRTFGVKVTQDFVILALDNLKRENLLENEIESPFFLPDVTRREIIKKIGLTSMIALPLMTVAIAPTAVNAQSNGNAVCIQNASGCQPTNNADLFVYTFNNNPTPFCQFNDPNCQTICDAAVTQCCSCATVLLPDTINAAFVCRCV